MVDLAARVAATEKVVARFRNRPFDWKDRATCIHLARAQARAMGHKPPAIPDFRSARGGLTALRATGHETLEALLDSMFQRIAPAAMLVGDLAVAPAPEPFGCAVGIWGGSALLGYHPDEPSGLANIKEAMMHITAAWRL